MKRYIAVIEIDDDEEIVGDANISYTYRSNGTNYGTDESVELKAEDERQRMKTYEDGLNEAWEVARKIVCNDGYNWSELEGIFERRSTNDILKTNTASEAIDRIKKYEGFNVGDEVINKYGWKRVVTKTHINGEITLIDFNGDFYAYSKEEVSDLKKTGRYFPQIKEVLEQIR